MRSGYVVIPCKPVQVDEYRSLLGYVVVVNTLGTEPTVKPYGIYLNRDGRVLTVSELLHWDVDDVYRLLAHCDVPHAASLAVAIENAMRAGGSVGRLVDHDPISDMLVMIDAPSLTDKGLKVLESTVAVHMLKVVQRMTRIPSLREVIGVVAGSSAEELAGPKKHYLLNFIGLVLSRNVLEQPMPIIIEFKNGLLHVCGAPLQGIITKFKHGYFMKHLIDRLDLADAVRKSEELAPVLAVLAGLGFDDSDLLRLVPDADYILDMGGDALSIGRKILDRALYSICGCSVPTLDLESNKVVISGGLVAPVNPAVLKLYSEGVIDVLGSGTIAVPLERIPEVVQELLTEQDLVELMKDDERFLDILADILVQDKQKPLMKETVKKVIRAVTTPEITKLVLSMDEADTLLGVLDVMERIPNFVSEERQKFVEGRVNIVAAALQTYRSESLQYRSYKRVLIELAKARNKGAAQLTSSSL